ncbi:RNA polymerase sigma factor SigJ [Undibacterium sp. NL8W]|uniref:RNA polymerase sigma factor SigJ n=2 Tax=Undibacterium umbellatum TaxID=2762300 RepID=A0ABR6Z922_9BURK|nr:RNA polymerase sigma factor SigJ [Undibacterium umbellatum]
MDIPDTTMMNRLQSFTDHRPRLFGLAYRMLASRAEAEDLVQNTYLRWHALTDEELLQIREPQAWLVTVISRLCIDRLRVLKRERENYTGPWLPEPMVEVDNQTPELMAEFSSDVSLAFLTMLERLSAEERAAFLLHQVFDVDYPEVAGMLNMTATACRQLVHRARERLQQDKPRFQVSRDHHRQLLQRFTLAAQSGDLKALNALFADDAQMIGDGGDKVASVNRILHGAARISRLYHVIARNFSQRMQFVEVNINGEPGLLRFIDGKLDATISIVSDGEKILDLYTIRNPDKLQAYQGMTIPLQNT